MKICFGLVAVLLSTTAFAQTITYSSLDLTDPADNSWPSSYPVFSSTTKPKAAETINMALQIASFGKCNTRKKPDNVKAQASDYVWKFIVRRPSTKLIEVTTIRTTLAFGMQVSPFDDVFIYHFDAESGDRIYPYQFFNDEMFARTKELAIGGLVKVTKDRKQQLLKEYPGIDPSEIFESTYDESCRQQMESEWTSETVRISIGKDAVTFITDDCENAIPRRKHETYSSAVPVTALQSMLSPVWNYYMGNGPKPEIDWVDHIWRGTLGTNIPVTIILRKVKGEFVLDGYEVYDNHGVAIPLSGGLTTRNVFFDEMDGDKILGTYTIEATDDVMTGTWMSGDTKKELPLKATRPK